MSNDRLTELQRSARVANTEQLLLMGINSIKRRYNRLMTPDLTDELDDLANHLLVPMMLHEHKQGEPCEPHVRVNAYLKLQNRPPVQPEILVLDFALEDFDALPTAEHMLHKLSLATNNHE